MALPTGLAAQAGFKAETSFGTAVVVDRFVPVDPDALKLGGAGIPETLESKGVVAGRMIARSDQRALGNISLAPSVGLELYDRSVALLFEHTFGTVVTSGTAVPYTHTVTPGDLTGKSLTVQIGVPDIGGTVQPFTYAGCKITKAQLSCKAGEIATLGLDMVARSVTTGTALATATPAATINPFTFVHGSLSIGGSAVEVMDFTLDIDNSLGTDRRYVGSQLIGQPLQVDHRKITGKGTLELSGLTQFGRHVAGTEAAVVLAFTLSTYSITITMNGRFTGGEPEPSRGITNLPFEFEAIGSTDANACTVVIVNGDSAA
jgi:hypothetical protein